MVYDRCGRRNSGLAHRTSTGLTGAFSMSVNGRVDTVHSLPNLAVLFTDARPDAKLLFLGPTDSDVVAYDVRFAQYGVWRDGSFNYTVTFGTDPPDVGGSEFPIVDGAVDLGIEGMGALEIVDMTTRRVWAQLAERGAAAALLVGCGRGDR